MATSYRSRMHRRTPSPIASPTSSTPPPAAFAVSPSQQREFPLSGTICIVPRQLYFMTIATNASLPAPTETVDFFSVDDILTYVPFFADFGPLNLGQLVKFCGMVKEKLKRIDGEAGLKRSNGEQPAQLPGTPQRDALDTGVCLVTSDNPHKRANGVFLACAYAVAAHGLSPHAAFAPFWGCSPPLLSFRDASFGLCSYALTILDCLNGVHAAMQRGFFSLAEFDLEAYTRDEQLHCGDINWIVPGLFCAFSGPLDAPKPLGDGKRTWAPADYVRYFKQPQHNVTLVVRLNKACYDKRRFTKAGVRHAELFYPDGGLAPPAILASFIDSVERNTGAVGVHCKAGLGRTGTCIGAYLMKHFRMTAREAIAWMRICRPGSVLGPQQQYLETLQGGMWQAGMDAGLHERWMHVAPPPVDLAAALGVNLAKAARRLGLRRVPGERPPAGSGGAASEVGGGAAPHRPSVPLRPAAAAWCAYAPWSLAALDVGCCVPGGVQAALHGTVPVAWTAVAPGRASRSERGIRRSRAPGDGGDADPPAPPLGALDWQLSGKCGAWSVTPAAPPVSLAVPPSAARGSSMKRYAQPGTPPRSGAAAAHPAGFAADGSSSSGASAGRRSGDGTGSGGGSFSSVSALRLTHLGPADDDTPVGPESPLTAVSEQEGNEAPDALDALEGSVDAEIRASLGGAGGYRTPHKGRTASDSDAPPAGRTANSMAASGSRSRLASAGGGSLMRPQMGAPTPSADVSEKVLPPSRGGGGDGGRQSPPPSIGSTGFTPQQGGGRSTPGSRGALTSSPLGVGGSGLQPAPLQRGTPGQGGPFASPAPSRSRPTSGTPTENTPSRVGSRSSGRTSPLTGAYNLSASRRR